MLIDIQENMAERHLRLNAKTLRMGFQEFSELFVRRCCHPGEIIAHELELLFQPPADDAVIPVKTQGQGLAIEDFFTHVTADEPLQFLFGRGALPGAGEIRLQKLDLTGCNNNPVGLGPGRIVEQTENKKKRRPNEQEVNQGLSQ